MPAVRLSDVAEDAGVSLATASRVLNGSSRVPGKEVAEKVRASAARLGYVPNAQAQALALSRSGLIGLLVHDIADPYFSMIARAVQQRVFAAHGQVLLTQTDRDVDTEVRALRSLIAQQVDALVLVGSHRYGGDSDAAIRTLLEGFERNGGVIVGLGQSHGVGRTIVTDDATVAGELATSLVVEGHRRFAVVGGVDGVPSAGHRTGGFVRALTEAGIEPELTVRADITRDGGHHAAAAVVEHLAGSPAPAGAEGLPLCLFAPADVMALGVIGELRRRGVEVPAQVAVAGYGGIPDGADSHPTLTTIALPMEAMAQKAVDWVLGEDAAAACSLRDAEGHEGSGDGGAAGSGDTAGAAASREAHMRGDVSLRESTAITARG